MIKIASVLLVVTALTTCSKKDNMQIALNNSLTKMDTLQVSQIQYADSTRIATFYPGFATNESITISKDQLSKLITVLNDSTNYSFADAKNCVMEARYGFKVENDSINCVLFLSKLPCMKLSVVDKLHHSEKTVDLKDGNTIVPLFESFFKKE